MRFEVETSKGEGSSESAGRGVAGGTRTGGSRGGGCVLWRFPTLH